MKNDLTDAKYWDQTTADAIQSGTPRPAAHKFEWMPTVLSFIGGRPQSSFLELGCSPGNVSAIICSHVPLRPEGVDFTESPELYLRNLRNAGVPSPIMYQCDVREFSPGKQYDIVGSFGLIEHFEDPQSILDIHDDLLVDGGLCIVEIPHFRKIQYLYHYLCDRPDLLRHNTACMTLDTFRQFAETHDHEILHLGYCGPGRFWGIDTGGSSVTFFIRRVIARVFAAAIKAANLVLSPDNPYAAPWILYVGQKRGGQGSRVFRETHS
jgi:SAM-dependent methyltransferase